MSASSLHGASPGARERLPLLIAAAVALVSLVLAVRMPGDARWLQVLNDAAHAPVFAALSLVTFAALGPGPAGRSRYVLAFVSTVALGGLVELLQIPIGRGASWYDVRTDALGAAAALAALAWSRSRGATTGAARRRPWPALVVALVCAAGVLAPIAESGRAYWRRAQQFPELASFRQRLDLYFLYPQSSEIRQAQLPRPWRRPDDPTSLRIRVLAGSYPGIMHIEPEPEWVGRHSLKFDVTNPAPQPLRLTLTVRDRMHDWRHEDRFNRDFDLPPRSRRVLEVPLGDIEAAPVGRRLDLRRIAGLTLFAHDDEVEPGREFYLTRMWLD